MATRRAKQDEIDDTAITSLPDDAFYSSDALNPALNSLYSELGVTAEQGETVVHVSLMDADGKAGEAHIWRGDPEDFDPEQLARTFGSGRYMVKVFVRDALGVKVQRARRVIQWQLSPADEAKRKSYLAELNASVAAAVPPPKPDAVPQADISRMIAEAVKAAVPQQPAVNPLAMMKEVAEVMRIMQPQQTVAQPDPFSMMRGVVEMMTMMKGESEPLERGANASGNDLILAMINKFGPLFSNVLASQPAAQMPQAQPAQPYPQLAEPSSLTPTVTDPQVESTNNQPAPVEDEVSIKLKMGIAFLIQQCEAGGAPETYAEVVLDSVPDDALKGLLASPDPVVFLSQYNADVLKHKDWFNSLLTEIRSFLEEDLTPEAEGAIKQA